MSSVTRCLSWPLSSGNPSGYSSDLKGPGVGRPSGKNLGISLIRVLVLHGYAAAIKTAERQSLANFKRLSALMRLWSGLRSLSHADTSQPHNLKANARGALGPLKISTILGIGQSLVCVVGIFDRPRGDTTRGVGVVNAFSLALRGFFGGGTTMGALSLEGGGTKVGDPAAL